MTIPVPQWNITLNLISSAVDGYKGYYPVEARYTELLQGLAATIQDLYVKNDFRLYDSSVLTRLSLSEQQIAPIKYYLGNLIKLTKEGINGQYLTEDMYNSKLDNLFQSLAARGIINNSGGNYDLQFTNLASDGSLPSDAGRISWWLSDALWSSQWFSQPTPTVSPSGAAPLYGTVTVNSLNNLIGSGPTDNSWLLEPGTFSQVSENIFNDIVKTGAANVTPTTPNMAILNLAGVGFGVQYSTTNSALFSTYTGTIQSALNGAALTGSLTSGQIALLNQSFGNLLKLAKDGVLSKTQINALNNIFTSLAEFSSSSLFGPSPTYTTIGWNNGANNTLTGVSTVQWQAWFQSILVNPGVLQPAVTVTSLANLGGTTFSIGSVSYQGQTQATSNAAVTALYDQAYADLLPTSANPSAYSSGNALALLNSLLYPAINLMVNGDGNGHYLTTQQMNALKAILPDVSDFPGTTVVEWGGVARIIPFNDVPVDTSPGSIYNIIKSVLASNNHALTPLQIQQLNDKISLNELGNVIFGSADSGTALFLHSLSGVSSFLAPVGTPQFTQYGTVIIGNATVIPWGITDEQWQNWIERVASNPEMFEPAISAEQLLPIQNYSPTTGNDPSYTMSVAGQGYITVDGSLHEVIPGTPSQADLNLAQIVRNAIDAYLGGSAGLIEVNVIGGIAILSGVTNNETIITDVTAIARQTPGVQRVVNNIITPYEAQGYYSLIANGDVAFRFESDLQKLQNAFSNMLDRPRVAPPGSPFTTFFDDWSPATASDVTAVQEAMGDLLYLAINGDGKGNYLSADQVRLAKMLFSSVQVAGVNWSDVRSNIANDTYIASNLDQLAVEKWFNQTINPLPHTRLPNQFGYTPNATPIFFISVNGGQFRSDLTLMYLAGNVVPFVTSAVDFSNFDTYITSIKQVLQQAAFGSGATPYLSSDQILTLNQNMGQLYAAAFAGSLSENQIVRLNSLFQSVSNFSSAPSYFGPSQTGTTTPLFPESVATIPNFPTSQWFVDVNNSLQGVTDHQWQDWFQSVLADQEMLNPLIAGVDLLPSLTVAVGGVPYTVKYSSSQTGTLTTQFNTALEDLDELTQGLDPFAALPTGRIEQINNKLQELIPLVVRGDGNNHFLTAQQLAQFQTAVNKIPNDGVHEGFLQVAGIVKYVLPATEASDADEQIFTQLVTQLNIILQTALSSPDQNGNFSFTSGQIATLNQISKQALDIAFLITNQSTGWGGPTIQTGRYTIEQLNALNALLKTLSKVSNKIVSPSDPANTAEWGLSTNFLNANASKNAAQWNSWLQLVVDNPDILAPLLKGTDILPLMFYDSNGLIPTAVNIGIEEDPSVSALYVVFEQTFQGILQAAISAGTLSESQKAQLNQVVGQLANLAKLGDGHGHYLSQAQANDVNTLFQTMKSFPASLGISVPSWSLNDSTSLQGMPSNAWTAWFYTLLNSPQQVFNQTRVYTLGTSLSESPIAWSSIGSVNIQARYSTLIQKIQSTLNTFGPSSDPTVLNDYLSELITLAQTGDNAGNLLTAAQAANIGNIFTSLSSFVANPNWTTVDLQGNRTISVTAAQWIATAPIVNAIQVIPNAPPNTVGVIVGGAVAFVPYSATENASLNTSLESIKNSIKAVLQNAAAAGAVDLTPDQMQDLQKAIAQLYLLLQNGNGQGAYFTQAQVSSLFSALNNISFFSSISPTQPQYLSPGWDIVQQPVPNITGISEAQWNLWYDNLMKFPNDLSPLATAKDTLPVYQYNFGGIPSSTQSVFPASVDQNSPSVVYIQGFINGYLTTIQSALQKAAGQFSGPHSINPPAVLTPQELADVKNAVGGLIKLAQDVNYFFTIPQAQNFTSLLQSLLAVVPSGWTLPTTADVNGNFALRGITDFQWNKWLNQIFSNPGGLSTLFPGGETIDLDYATLLAAGYIPTSTIHLAGVSTTIVTPNVSADSDLLSSYNTQVSGIAGFIQQLVQNGFNASSTLSSAEASKLNEYVGQLINLAQNGDNGNLLTAPLATKLDQLLTSLSAFSSTSLSGVNHTAGWSLDANHVLQGVDVTQWSQWVQNLIANPTTVSSLLQRATVTVAGIPTSLWVAVTSSSEPQVEDAYTQLVHDVRLLLQQMKASGVTTLSAAQITTLNQAVGLLVYLVRNDGINGYAITDTMAQNLNTLFASLDDFSTTTVVSTAPNYTAGWVLDNTGALTATGVNGATSTSITAAQWQAWATSVLTTPSQLSPLYPVDFLSSLALADAGVVPSTTMDIAGVLKKVQVAPSMSDAITMAFNTNLQGLKNVIVGFVAMGLTNPTTAQIGPYIEILNKNLGALMDMVAAGSLTASAANSLNVLLTSLSTYSTTTVAFDNPAFSTGWIPTSNFVSETAVTDNQWLNWLKFVTAPENQNSLSPLIPGNSFAGPFLTLNLGGVILNLPFSVVTTNELNSRYNTLVGDIGDILKASKTSTTLTSSQITQLQQDVGTLLQLSQYGDGRGNVLTIEMQKNISLLASSLTASGAQTFVLTPVGTNAYSLNIGNAQLWNVWRDLALSSNMLQGFLKSESTTINAQRSLQAMVELNYVKLGNDMLATQLSGLQNALNTTQTILNTLTGLQNIHNQIVVSSKMSFSAFFNPSAGMKSAGYKWKNPTTFQVFGGTSGNGFAAAYKYYASAYFGLPISPTIETPPGSKYQLDISNPNDWLVEILYNQPPLLFGSTGKVNTFSPTNTTGSGKSSSTSSANTTYEGFYIQVPNNFTVPQSVIDQFHLKTPSSIVASVSLLVPGSPGYSGDFGIGNSPPTPDSYTKLRQPLFTGGTVGSITQQAGYTLWITSTSFPAVLDPRSNSQFTTSSTNFATLRSVLDKLDELKPKGYTYDRTNEGVRTLAPPTNDSLKTFITQTLGGFPTGLTSTINNLLTNKATLSAQLASLSELAPSTVTDPNSLYSMTKKVYEDLKSSLVTRTGAPITQSTSYAAGFSGLAKWLLDGYQKLPGETGAVQAGRFQQNITFAVTAAQSLNSQQQQKVSNYLFVFEEFQKSAAAILQQLTQIIQHIAQNIAR